MNTSSLYLKLALRNLARQKMRSGMTLAAIIIGTMGLILAGGFVQDVLTQLGEATIHSQTGHVQIFKKGYLTTGSRSPERYLVDNANQIAEMSAQTSGVQQVSARLTFSGSLSNGKRDLAILGEGVEADKEALLGSMLQIIQGQPLTSSDVEGVLIGEGVAANLALKPGDRVTLLTTVSNESQTSGEDGGTVNTQELHVTGIFRSFSKDFDARAIRLNLSAAQDLRLTQGANLIVIMLNDTQKSDRTARLLNEKLTSINPALEARAWDKLSDFYDKTVTLYKTQFGLLQLIVLLMVILSVSNSVNMGILERIAEFGTTRALGDMRRDVFKQIIIECAVLGGIGALLGMILGIIAALLTNYIGISMPPPPNSNQGYTAGIELTAHSVIISALIGMIGTSLASLYPAWKVSRIPIVDALRQNI